MWNFVKVELLELAWLVSAIGGLSILAVLIAVALSIA